MSVITLKEFYEKAVQDPALGRKLATLSREFHEKLRALAAEAGYELAEATPLSDEEASGAAGGRWSIYDDLDDSWWPEYYRTHFGKEI